MNKAWARKNTGFTIVELLIVIVVIAILAAISIVAYNGIQQRARDARREQDMAMIKKTLLLYQADNGGVPATSTYGSVGNGGWDSSDLSGWLSFLNAMYGKMPVDPINTPNTSFAPNSGRTYFYYCYPAGSGGLPATTNVRMGYISERSGTNVLTDFAVEKCL